MHRLPDDASGGANALGAAVLSPKHGSLQLIAHPESWLECDKLGEDVLPYKPNFRFEGAFINSEHHCLTRGNQTRMMVDVGIPGWLWIEDALKLYELSYFAAGDVLEFGTYRGLSTYVMVSALKSAGQGRRIVSIDHNAESLEHARKNTERLNFPIEFACGDALEQSRRLLNEGRRFAFVFVDHSHTYDAVSHLCKELESVMTDDGMVAFHDYNDSRNGHSLDYGVFQAVQDSFRDGNFKFVGVYGCLALFWRFSPATLRSRSVGALGPLRTAIADSVVSWGTAKA
jgi:hypothetical protein